MTNNILRAVFGAVVALPLFVSTETALADPFYVSWGQLYKDAPPSESQVPAACAVDSRGNVFVTGWQTSGSGKAAYIAKYDALDGHRIWFREIVPAGTNQFLPTDIAVDSQGDCVITGSQNVGGAIDYYTRKFHGTDGTNYWGPKTFNGANGGEDTALRVICDHNDDVIITGRSVGQNGMGNSTAFDWATIRYDKEDAVAPVVSLYSQTTSNFDDVPAGVAVDSDNNVYVAGMVQVQSGEFRLYLRKLRASDLAKQADIVPIDTGANGADSEGGATAIAIDADDNIIVTGVARDGANHFGYFTISYTSGLVENWRTSNGPFSQGTFGTPYSPDSLFRPKPIGIAIGPDNAPMITGTLLNAAGDAVVCTVKYTQDGLAGTLPEEVWDGPSIDTGAGFGDTKARAIIADGLSNAIVVGETENEDGHTDLYLAKYDALTGQRVFAITFNGSTTSSADKGVDVAVDHLGNVTALGNLIAHKGGSPSAGFSQFGIFKLNRLIAPTGEDLPNGITGVADTAKITVAGAPALSDVGDLVTKVTFKAGTKTGSALLLDGPNAGITPLPVIKGQPAPVAPGEPAANWSSFSDPVMSPDGSYAFAGKVTGTPSKANGVWTNLGGTLRLALRQGSIPPVAGLTDKLSSVLNIAIENNALVALVKLTGAPAAATALIRLDNANVGTLLLRTGQSGLMINGEDYTIKTITIFTPPVLEAGDGRYQGSGGVVAKVTATKTIDAKVKTTAIVSVTHAGAKVVRFATGQPAAAPVASANYGDFSFPSTGFGSSQYAVKATLAARPATSNSALIYSPTAGSAVAFAQKGVATGVPGFGASVIYGDYSDPIVNENADIAFIATLKGSAADVKPTTNKAVILRTSTGGLNATIEKVARTGDFATDSAGDVTTAKWTAFSQLALPSGVNAGPIFVGKISTPKNNIGLWARDSNQKLRQLLKTGDDLDGQIVKSFTLLKAVSKAAAAPRSFDEKGSVGVFVTFTNKKSAILRIGIP